jgi:hypothetical protein
VLACELLNESHPKPFRNFAMDGFPSYRQPTNTSWLRMLFLSTGFVIGGMCLWAFVQKQSAQRENPVAKTPPATAEHNSGQATSVLQVAQDAPEQTWPQESPARAALESARPLPASVAVREPTSPWQFGPVPSARQASFEVAETQPVHVSKPPLVESEQFIPLPDFSPLDQSTTQQVVHSHEPQPAQNTPTPQHADSTITLANDSFWEIAKRVYGDPRYYAALFEHNRNWIAYPDQIEQGFRVMTPPVEELHTRYAELCPDLR